MSSEKSLTPQIRFKGFTEAWEQRKLKDLFAYGGSGGTPSSNNRDYYNGNIPFLNISDLKERNIRFTEKQITTLGLHNSAAWIVPAGSISLAMYASVGKVGIICNDTATSQAFYNMVFQDILVRNFLYTRLEKADFCNEWEPYISTGTQRNLNAEKVRNFKINIPSKHEMNQIGSIFEVLDSLITLHQRKLDALKKIKSALLEKMFPKDGSDIPEIRFAGFTEAWEQRKFLKIYRKNDERNDDRLSANKTLSVATMIFNCGGNGASDESLPNYKRLRIGDIAFEGHANKEFSFGRFVLNDAGDGIMSPRFTCLRPITKQDYSFWKYYIHSEKVMREKLVNSTKSGTMMNELVVEDFLNESILVPSLEEQREIGFVFKSLTNLITLHQRKLDALKKIKSALLEKMFV